MRRQRFQIALLVLGVVLGYGHAFTHRYWHWNGHEYCTKHHGRDFGHGEHYDRGRPSAQDHPRPAEPNKPEI